jgi:hypothetical protein
MLVIRNTIGQLPPQKLQDPSIELQALIPTS